MERKGKQSPVLFIPEQNWKHDSSVWQEEMSLMI